MPQTLAHAVYISVPPNWPCLWLLQLRDLQMNDKTILVINKIRLFGTVSADCAKQSVFKCHSYFQKGTFTPYKEIIIRSTCQYLKAIFITTSKELRLSIYKLLAKRIFTY